MKSICILIFTTLLLSGTTLSNKAEVPVVDSIEKNPIKVILVADRVQKIDSLFLELNKNINDKKHN